MESELKCLTSESGLFYVDAVGAVWRFESAVDNPFMDTVEDLGHSVHLLGFHPFFDCFRGKWHKTIRTLIIPQGVTEFCEGFMRGVHVLERFELPKGITRFGFNGFGCVFAECRIPFVAMPETVQEIGCFCFGHCLIHRLRLPLLNRCEYERQFKDSAIEVLELPSALKGCVWIESGNRLTFDRERDLPDGAYGCFSSIGANALVGRIAFY